MSRNYYCEINLHMVWHGHGKVLEWQGGYGVVSFGTRDLEWVKAYIRNQKEHHAKGTTHGRLEAVENDD